MAVDAPNDATTNALVNDLTTDDAAIIQCRVLAAVHGSVGWVCTAHDGSVAYDAAAHDVVANVLATAYDATGDGLAKPNDEWFLKSVLLAISEPTKWICSVADDATAHDAATYDVATNDVITHDELARISIVSPLISAIPSLRRIIVSEYLNI